MTPTQLKPKEFEQALLDAAEKHPLMSMGRYGVQSFTVTTDGAAATRPVQSLPDFEGAYAPLGNQFIIEAKVCSTSAFPLDKSKLKPRQVKHMIERTAVGVPCFLIIHFNERKLVKTHEPAETRAIRIHPLDDRWTRYVKAYADAKRWGKPVEPQGSLSRDLICRMSVKVNWVIPPRCKKALPDLGALLGLPSDEQPSLSLFP